MNYKSFLLVLLMIGGGAGCSQKQPDQIIEKELVLIVPPKVYLECKELPIIPEFTLESFDSEIMIYVTELWNTAEDCYTKLNKTREFIESKKGTLKTED